MAGAGPPHTVKRSEITVKRTDTPQPQPTPAPVIGTDVRSAHRTPAPTPAQHNATFTQPTASEDYAAGEAVRTGINSTSHGIR